MLPFKAKETLILEPDGLLGGRHVSLRPTKLCISLTVLSLAVWVGAVNYQVNVAYAVCFWILGFIGIAALMTRRQLLGLHIQADYSGEIFAGQTAEVLLHSPDSGKRNRLFWLRSEWAYDADPDNPEETGTWQRCELSGSLKNPWTKVWPVAITRRGYFPQPLLLRLGTSAPFGLFHAEALLQWQTDAVAYPAPLPHSDFGNRNGTDPEQIPQLTGANGDDIAYLKDHQPGASLQHVAWKVYAKRGELMDKVFDEPPPAAHSTTISYRDYPQGTPADKLAGLLAYRVLQADQTGLPYVLELPNTTLTPQKAQREKCLNALALM